MSKTPADHASKVTDITAKVVKLLVGLDSDGRQKVIQASLTLLGEKGVDLSSGGGNTSDGGKSESSSVTGLSPKANAWIKQNGLTFDQIEQLFDINGVSAGLNPW